MNDENTIMDVFMKNNKSIFRNIALISQLGINVMAPTLILLFIGLWVDSWLQTSWCGVVFMFFGILGGGKSAYDIAMNALKMDEQKEEDPQAVVDRVNQQRSSGGEASKR